MADPRTLLAEARDLFQQGRLQEASAIVGRLAEASPRDPVVLNFRAYLAWKRGRAEEAIGDYRRLLDLEPRVPGHAANLGLVLFRTQRYAEALDAWTRQLELQPGDAKALRGAAACHERLGHPEQALECFERAGDAEGVARLQRHLAAAGPAATRAAGATAGPPAAAPGGGSHDPAEGREAPEAAAWLAAAAARPGESSALAGAGEAQVLAQVRGKVLANPAYLAAHRGVLVFAPTTREAGKAAGRFGDPRLALVRAEGNGELVLAGGGRRMLALRLAGGRLFVNAPALAFCGEGVEMRFEPSGMRKGIFQAAELSGSGPLVLAVRGGALVLPVPVDLPTLVRPHAAVAWTEHLLWEAETVDDLKRHAGKEEALRYRFEGRGHILLQAV